LHSEPKPVVTAATPVDDRKIMSAERVLADEIDLFVGKASNSSRWAEVSSSRRGIIGFSKTFLCEKRIL
jgi:hypothetical protein